MAPRKLIPGSKPLPLPSPKKTAKRGPGQEALPVSFRAAGTRFATLADHFDPSVPTLSMDELTHDQWLRIVARRIKAQPRFSLVAPGRSKISKTQVAREVLQATPLGAILTRIEANHVRAQIAGFKTGTPKASGGKKVR